MADIPNRLPQPVKRSTKISKSAMRMLYRTRLKKQREKRRSIIDAEIEQETKRNNSIHMRKSAKSRKYVVKNGKLTVHKAKKAKKKVAQTYIEPQVPCIFERPGLIDPDAQHVALTKEEVPEDAILWESSDYPHIIPNPKLYVACFCCHLWMPSTTIPCIVCTRYPMRRWVALHHPCLAKMMPHIAVCEPS